MRRDSQTTPEGKWFKMEMNFWKRERLKRSIHWLTMWSLKMEFDFCFRLVDLGNFHPTYFSWATKTIGKAVQSWNSWNILKFYSKWLLKPIQIDFTKFSLQQRIRLQSRYFNIATSKRLGLLECQFSLLVQNSFEKSGKSRLFYVDNFASMCFWRFKSSTVPENDASQLQFGFRERWEQ